ncbi:MAG: plastocyanin/azurin family copper-binding protein [Candidatus Nitrosocaldus sp.]|nr:plastocyanin/azurin family copper-binding protein [Candidatus Nitrosocaldus sp.]MDW8000213.1 plastocyanin/azurin family copper-binding protein [Candidatus Nitrosocaldus sp.]MDW8275808.1 plastocyanin/azurin family copper-binding protein [Candidatus Nitrosocaldus sp.]
MKYSNLLTLSILSIAVASLALYGNSKQASAAEFIIEMPVGSQNMACNPAYSPTGDWMKMLNDKCFKPATLTVPAGSTVTFVNKDTASHTVAFASNPLDATTWKLGDPKFDSGLVLPNGKWSVVLEEAGEHPYVCYVHPWMIGRVIVEAAAPPPANLITLSTDNNRVKVEVEFSAGTATDSMLTVDPPQEVTFNIRFIDPASGKLIEHVNYDFKVIDANGNAIVNRPEQHTHTGDASHKVNFASTGAYTIDINVLGTGINKPFDTKHSGKSALSISVVPEFPLGMIAVFASIAGIAVAMSRLRGRLSMPMNY